MPDYTKENTLRIAKRIHNTRRTYLLVNPLQAKHIPVQPSRALEMMRALGNRLAAQYPQTRLVIGFAETATAIGAVAAGCISSECVYLHTTREEFPCSGHWVEFLEEHSHAAEQRLSGDHLAAWLEKTDCVILVDDEVSTGKTLINMVRQLKRQYPRLEEKTIVAASILNRVSPENERRMEEAGIQSEYLVKLAQEDYDALVEKTTVREAEAAEAICRTFEHQTLSCRPLRDPRLGMPWRDYEGSCREMADAFISQMLGRIPSGSRILVLGTEECMYPALVLGAALEKAGRGDRIRCHATTRSPIGVCREDGYPIVSGSRIESFYDPDRVTYLYDLEDCDAVIVVSDTPVQGTEALCSLLAAFPGQADRSVFYLQGGQDVWYL